jgi:hypothetical protein
METQARICPQCHDDHEGRGCNVHQLRDRVDFLRMENEILKTGATHNQAGREADRRTIGLLKAATETKDRIIEELEAADPSWRPMRSAPADGTVFWVEYRSGRGGCLLGKWVEKWGAWATQAYPSGRWSSNGDTRNLYRWRPAHKDWASEGGE